MILQGYFKAFRLEFIILSLVTSLFRLYLHLNFSYFSLDDEVYIRMATYMRQGKFFSTDGQTPHLNFPPGNSILVFLFRLVTPNIEVTYLVIWLVSTFAVNLLVLSIAHQIGLRPSRINLYASFLCTSFLTIDILLGSNLESSFVVFSLIALKYLLKYKFDHRLKNLLIANLLFCWMYLMRPEAIILLLSAGVFTFQSLRKHQTQNISKLGMCFAVPFAIFVLPYVFYLKKYSGFWEISGKWRDHVTPYFSTFSGMTSHLAKNFLRTGDLFLSPNLVNPLIVFCVVLYLLEKDKKRIPAEIILFPIPLFAVFLSVLPAGRPFLVIVPILLLITMASLNNMTKKWLPLGVIVFTSGFIIFSQLVNGTFNNNPGVYYDLSQRLTISKENQHPVTVFSRGIIANLENEPVIRCGEPQNCISPKYLILSNLSHIGLIPASGWELNGLHANEIQLNDATCSRELLTERHGMVLAIFECSINGNRLKLSNKVIGSQDSKKQPS